MARFRVLHQSPPTDWQPAELPSELYPQLYQVGICPEAWAALRTHVGWGQHTPTNGAEQGGLLLGQPLRDPKRPTHLVRLTHALPAHAAEGSMQHLHLGYAVWQKLLQQAEMFAPEQRVVGWYHTHPRYLRVYLSDTDRRLQAQLFAQDWHIALVMNPQRRIIRAFRGAAGLPTGVGFEGNLKFWMTV